MAVENFTSLFDLGRRNFERNAMSFVCYTQCSWKRKVKWMFLSYCLIIQTALHPIEDNFGSLLQGPKMEIMENFLGHLGKCGHLGGEE
jgi:hypothetical protein